MNHITIRDQLFEWGKRTYLMGILNVTPDSFSDGGQFNTLDAALEQAAKMVAEGADIIDLGGQSTRPGAEEISLDEELKRVIPVIKALRPLISVPISIDTTRAAVARAAIEAGADLINDISGGTFDEQMFLVAATLDVPIILMHIRGTPKTMQQLTDYQDLIREISEFFANQILKAMAIGIKRSHLMIDPGLGFAKTDQQNLEILRQINQFRSLDVPILVGPSRKRFIGHILQQKDPQQRVWGTAAACCAAIASGADLLRVHDVKPMSEVCRVADAIWRNHQ
ncbi:dihydropteroate synthase [Gloeothece verrucosa]|uniref:Dihydropteroate synthase n=1 Tax=Gloeothece verrucosa (strain PCC 7822) TaxID=497965 RepID=E0U6F7_GLOV7|nr:dihydropteroate synthase [Gloeothece verrucosa]ADN13600.1 dihydropteroate synthase [Gloeothece verrucosa PCC 7822]